MVLSKFLREGIKEKILCNKTVKLAVEEVYGSAAGQARELGDEMSSIIWRNTLFVLLDGIQVFEGSGLRSSANMERILKV